MKYNAILVLGITLDENNNLTEKGKKRVEKGVELLKNGKADKIIFSGKYSYQLKKEPSKTEAQAMKDYALSFGIDQKYIVMEENAVSTVTNLYYVKNNILIPNNWDSLIIVSEMPHVERVEYNAQYILGDDYHIEIVASNFPFTQEDIDMEKLKMPKVVEFFSKYKKGEDRAMFDDAMEEVRRFVEENKLLNKFK